MSEQAVDFTMMRTLQYLDMTAGEAITGVGCCALCGKPLEAQGEYYMLYQHTKEGHSVFAFCKDCCNISPEMIRNCQNMGSSSIG